ncbi:MAG: GNAT family N-acetyltransferase [Shimia sp.]
MTIRPLQPGDEAGWRALWTAYLDFYDSEVAEEVYTTTFARLTDPAHRTQHALVAIDGDRLTGLVHFLLHPHNWRTEDVIYLQDLYADPSVRGTGVGRKLIEAVYDWADANGTPSVYWLTQEHNTAARQLYDRIATHVPFVKYQR